MSKQINWRDINDEDKIRIIGYSLIFGAILVLSIFLSLLVIYLILSTLF